MCRRLTSRHTPALSSIQSGRAVSGHRDLSPPSLHPAEHPATHQKIQSPPATRPPQRAADPRLTSAADMRRAPRNPHDHLTKGTDLASHAISAAAGPRTSRYSPGHCAAPDLNIVPQPQYRRLRVTGPLSRPMREPDQDDRDPIAAPFPAALVQQR